MEKKIASSWWRAGFHFTFGFGAMFFAQILRFDEDESVRIAEQICFWAFTADVVRVVLHRILWWEPVVRFFQWKPKWSGFWILVSVLFVILRSINWFLLFFEKWVLHWTHIIRDHEKELLSALTPFALGVLLPLWWGIPLSAVMLGVVILGFGDPIAREWAKAVAKARADGMDEVEIRKVFTGGKKTWTGYRGFCASAGIGVFISSALDLSGWKVFPEIHHFFFLIAFPLGVVVGGYAELAQEWIHMHIAVKIRMPRLRWLFEFLMDDNLLVPIGASVPIGIVFLIGQAVS
ncbi:hypothetical protein HN481_04320 [Candidatus Parcubacteria bacterium]|nr:hypothetical protein [Candidatus Parcubacteria bacterium]